MASLRNCILTFRQFGVNHPKPPEPLDASYPRCSHETLTLSMVPVSPKRVVVSYKHSPLEKGRHMHQPMKQLPERAISEEEAREILRIGEYCVVATVDDDGHPYATPLSYVLDGDTLLIHTGIAGGQKTDDWQRDPRVCVTVALDMDPVYVEENNEPGFFTTRFASVIATGTVRPVTDTAQIRRALAQICLKYCPEYREKIGAAIDWELPATAVWAIDLNHISGKAGRRIPNGKGAVRF